MLDAVVSYCTLSSAQQMAAYLTNLVASCLSIIGSSAIIINYLFFLGANKRNQPLYQLILYLSVSDFFGSISICISQSVLLSSLTYYHSFCIIIRASINFFFVSSFMWMSCIAFHAFWSSRQRSQIPLIVFHAFSWGVPVIMTGVMVGKGMIIQEEDTGYCHPDPEARYLFWYGPLIFTFAWNILFYALILWRYRASMRPMGENMDRNSINTQQTASHRFVSERKRKIHAKVARQLGVYLLAFLICWLPDLIDNFVATPARYCELYWLWVLQNFTTPLQGFLNFIVYGITSRMFLRCKTTPTDIRALHESRSQKISLLRGVAD
ncbi:G-protein-coupled receptor family protein [Heterostelium album PN500]|uniref:G-protein-coupled receptor family protein n=1 Tax=Heterostelium pallidum (strain ATCC 26659 / Pp 5 / PN500) TaxID=670386 RepID=D3BB91_HETP5|nr:G-protein-coupled receptor family protein [Heterostelium album PN500]EFA81298.1 G-protein-coupled receptor family protein [Heterostelium album PN500]|eukprot:XP_020433416.1 G-protein-coupled receptor family protein [Heterostelium album PN500]